MRLRLAGFAIAVVPALAQEAAVVVKATADNRFDPDKVEIKRGGEVVWTNHGFHNVKFDDGSFEKPSSPSATWTEESRVFDQAGTFTYFCEAHPNMKGTVVVKEDGTTTGTTGTTTTTTTTPTTTTTDTTTTTTTPAEPPPPAVSVKATGSSFCARKSRRCRRPGVVLRITSDTPHRVEGRLLRPNGLFGKIAFEVPAGTRTVRFTRTREGRRLTPGRYSVKLGTAPVVKFRIR